MAEKIQPKMPIPPLLVTARPAKKSKKRKSEAEKAATKKRLEKARGQTRVNIGAAFKQWRQLRHLKGLKTDAEVAAFLLDGRLEDDFAAFRRWQREEGGTRAEKAVSGEEKKFPCESTEVARLEKRDSEPTPSTPRSYKKLCPAPPTPTLVPACAPPLILSRLATTMIVCQNLTEVTSVARMGRQCQFPGCKSTTGMHSFPTDPELRRQWIHALGLQDRNVPSRAGVCNRHFSPDSFSNTMEVNMGYTKVLMLKSNAVPNVGLSNAPPPVTATARPSPTTARPAAQGPARPRLLLPAPPPGAAGTNRIFPLKDAACQTDPPGTHFRSKGIQTKVARKDCGMCTLTFPLDSPLLFLQPTIVKRPSKRRRPSLEDEKKAPSKCKLAMEVFE